MLVLYHKECVLLFEGPAKASTAPSKSAGILSYSTMPDARPVHLRLGNKSVLPPGVGEGDSIATGTCSLNSGRTKTWTASAEPKTAASWNDSVERTATRCQKISFNSDAFISNTGQSVSSSDTVRPLSIRLPIVFSIGKL